MSAGHFVKHLFRLNSRHILPRPSSPSFPLLSCLSAALSEADNRCTAYATFRRFSASSAASPACSETAAESEPFASSYLSVRIQCRKDMADVLSEALLCFGASSISIDQEDGPASSDEISIDSIFPPDEDVTACISSAADSVGLKELPRYEVEMRDQEDWITKSQVDFRLPAGIISTGGSRARTLDRAGSAGHFVKHLFRLNSRHILPRPSSPSFPLLSCLSAALSEADNRCTAYATFRRFSASSAASPACSETAAESEPFASSYLSVRIQCRKDMDNVLSEALLCFGASSISIDQEDGPASSNEISIDSIFPPDEDVTACISSAADSVGLKELPRYEVEMRDQEDWITKSQESFQPVEVAQGLWIVPERQSPPDVNATNIVLNPGLAFGTGEHATTRLCLQLLHGFIKGGEQVLDYGTGSGVLAIAALKLGASLADGVDIDPMAISSARQNAVLNNIRPGEMRLHLVHDNHPTSTDVIREDEQGRVSRELEFVLEEEKYDVVIANILLNPLLDLADQIVYYAKPGATVGLSGILLEQVPYITSRYADLLEDDISISELDDWACVSGRKKKQLGGN